MSDTRVHPFDLVFGDLADDRFPPIRDATGETPEIDDWLMDRTVVELLDELRPDGGLGSAVDDFVVFVHAAYCFWAAGRVTIASSEVAFPVPHAMYIQVAPHRIWARLGDEDTHEPVDGWFVMPAGERLRVVACMGVHPGRPGLSVLTAEGARPVDWARTDGSELFAPLMCGGETAGLSSIGDPEELLLMAWGTDPSERTPDGDDGSKGGGKGD